MNTEENSTKLSILERANSIINKVGMSDFRIDTLSQSLKVSPGNITYHFPKKDDISFSIWQNCQRDLISSTASQVNQFMDIKQLYLLFRQIITTLYSYRGTLNYMLGDGGVIFRSRRENRELLEALYQKYIVIKGHLVANKVINGDLNSEFDSLCFESHITLLGWSVNHAYTEQLDDINSLAERYALVALSPLLPFMEADGIKQYNDILSLVEPV